MKDEKIIKLFEELVKIIYWLGFSYWIIVATYILEFIYRSFIVPSTPSPFEVAIGFEISAVAFILIIAESKVDKLIKKITKELILINKESLNKELITKQSSL